MDLINKDLNLLNCLNVLAEVKSLSAAAKRLGLSQPALSYQLKNLREQFGDQLFIRTRKGYVLTPRTEVLLPEVRSILKAAENLYSKPKFDLKSHTQEFVLASSTYFEAMIVERLVPILRVKAPCVTLKTIALDDVSVNQALDSGKYDLAVAAYIKDVPKSFYLKKLGFDHQVCVVRKNHPYLSGTRSLKSYLSFDHIKIDIPNGSVSRVDQLLKVRKLGERKLVARFGNFLTPALALSASDCILTVPSRLAKIYENHFKLRVVPLPTSKIEIETNMIWHERQHRDDFNRWIRTQIEEIFYSK